MKQLFAVLLLLAPQTANADPEVVAQVSASATAIPTDVTLVRLENAHGAPLKWSYVPAGRSERFGHAEVLVAAPVSSVRTHATDFAHYRELSGGRLRTTRLVDRRPGSTDVYIQLPVLHGMVTLWEVLRFSDLQRASDGTESFVGKLISGNVQSSELSITMRPIAGGRTILQCDMHMAPQFVAPQSVVDRELRDAAEAAIVAIRTEAETRHIAGR